MIRAYPIVCRYIIACSTGTSLLCFYFYPLCCCSQCSALKIYLFCSRREIVVRLLCFLCAILREQFTTCDRQFNRLFYQNVLIKGYEVYNNIILYLMMTVLLEYIDCAFATIIHRCLILLLIFVSGFAKTEHICTNYTCLENGTFLGHHL